MSGKMRDSQGGRCALAYLDALLSGDRDIIRAAILEHYHPAFLDRVPSPLHFDAYVDQQMAPYYETAGSGYEMHSARGQEDKEVRVTLRNNLTRSWVELQVPVSQSKIAGRVKLRACPSPAGAPPTERWSDDQIVERIGVCLDKLVEDDTFSGAVLVARSGQPLLAQAHGLASKSYQVPNRIDTKFNVASLGKMFTGVAIAQLAERGVLLFEDPAAQHLPEGWLGPEASARIQIQHLLTHTSGLGDYFPALHRQPATTSFRSLEDYRTLVADQTLVFEPGTRFSYSNTGMLLLGVVIEQLTGQSYFEYVREHVYEPAGMVDSDAFEKDVPVANRATGYSKTYVDGAVVWRSNLVTTVVKGSPSGGSFSTVEDLLRFDAALRAHKLLSPACTERALTPKPALGAPGHGYGFFVREGDAGRVASHGGDGRGINAQFSTYLDRGYTIAVLANYDPPAANIVHNVCRALIDASQAGAQG